MTRNFVRPARNFAAKFRLMPRNFVSIHCIACEIFAEIRTIEAPKFRCIFAWNESSKFDCRNSRNFADFGKFRLHFFCTVLYLYPNHLNKLLCHLQCFFKDQRKKDWSEFEPDTISSFQKTTASHWRVNTHSALSFDRVNFKRCL